MTKIAIEDLRYVVEKYMEYCRDVHGDNKKYTVKELFAPLVYNPLFFILTYFPQYIYQVIEGKRSFMEGWQVHVCRFVGERAMNNKFPIKVYVCGGKYIGKTIIESLLGLWFLFVTRGNHGRYLAFSGREEQLKTVLFKTITSIVDDKKGLGDQVAHARPEGNKFYIKHKSSEEKPKKSFNDYLLASTWSSHKPDSLSGVHAPYIMYIVDEAQSIANNIFPYWEGIYADPHTFSIMCGNGTIYDSHFCRIVREGSPNDDSVLALQVSVEHCYRETIDHKKIKQSYSMYPKEYVDIFYYGKIIKSVHSSFFDLVVILEALRRGENYRHPVIQEKKFTTDSIFVKKFHGRKDEVVDKPIVAIDVGAGSGRDASVVVVRTADNIEIIFYSKDAGTQDLRKFLKDYCDSKGGVGRFSFVIDGDGLGKAVAIDLSKHEKINPHLIHGNKMPSSGLYEGMRAFCYVAFKNWLIDNPKSSITISNDLNKNLVRDRIIKEANDIYFVPDKRVFSITEKKDMSFSPDILDAVSYSFYNTNEIETFAY